MRLSFVFCFCLFYGITPNINFLKDAEISFLLFVLLALPLRITGLRVEGCKKNSFPYPIDYPTHVRIHYKTVYNHLDNWQKVMENDQEKVYAGIFY